MVKISFITFTRNSAKLLPKLLDQVKGIVDEIIVVDGYSEDRTVEIARSLGARVYLRKPWGYADPDRMFALKMASYDWILHLDTDERLGKALRKDLKNIIIKAPKEASAFSITRINISHNGKIVLGPFYPDRQIRLFKKSKATYKGLVHELPIIYGSVYSLPENYYIIHISTERNFWPEKLSYYAKLEAAQYYKRKTRSRIRKILWTLAPLSIPLIYFYYVISSIMLKKPLNSVTLLATLKLALYEGLVHTFMKIRNEKQKRMSKLIQEKGIIQLLGL